MMLAGILVTAATATAIGILVGHPVNSSAAGASDQGSAVPVTDLTTQPLTSPSGGATVTQTAYDQRTRTSKYVPTVVVSSAGEMILGIGSGLCITPMAPASGAQLELAPCHASADQSWRIAPDGTIRSQGMCMDVGPGSGDGDGTPVVRDTCTGSRNQVFDLDGSNDLTSAGTGFLCIGTANQGTDSGAPLRLRPCTGGEDQQWKILSD